MLRTAILSEIGVDAGLLVGDSGWVFVVQHQNDAPDLPFERWAAASSRMSSADARTMINLFAATTFRCSKCNRTSTGDELEGETQLACAQCGGLALKRLKTPDPDAHRPEQGTDEWGDTAYLQIADAEPVSLYPTEEALAEPVMDNHHVEVVPVVGKLGDQNGPRFEAELQQLLSTGVRQIVIDLSRCDTIGASGLTALQRISNQVRASGGRLVIAEVSSRVRRALEMFGAKDEFDLDHSTRGATRRLMAQDLAG